MDAILAGYDSNNMGLRTMAANAKGPKPSAGEWHRNKIEVAGYDGVSIKMEPD